MERNEFREGLKVFRAALKGLQRIVADPAAIERIQARARLDPGIMLGEPLDAILGSRSGYGGESHREDD